MSDQDKSGSMYNDLRLEGDFCDAHIKVGDIEFPIHKVILCKSSSYFWWVCYQMTLYASKTNKKSNNDEDK